MAQKFLQPLDAKLADSDAERVRRSHSEAIKELQRTVQRLLDRVTELEEAL